MNNFKLKALAASAALLSSVGAIAGVLNPIPRYDHVVIVIMENHGYSNIIGSSSAPYINSLANAGANFTASHGVTHPSQPNYLALFSGSTQGVTNDNCPMNFSGQNLGSQLIGASYTFKGYSESMPSAGYTGCSSGNYARKHNPWVDFSTVPAASNLTFTSFPSSFSTLPTVSVVVPNLCNDMHDCSISTGDAWLQTNIAAYATWAKSNNSLLIVTFDEDTGTTPNTIPTIFYGGHVTTAQYAESFTHYGVLRTLEDMYGVTPLNNAASATPITDVFTASSSSVAKWSAQAASLSASTGSSLSYSMAVPSGATNLKFTTSGGSGDVDVYVKYGSAATTTSYDCVSSTVGSNAESCTIGTASAGTYYVMMKATSAFSGVTLSGTYTK